MNEDNQYNNVYYYNRYYYKLNNYYYRVLKDYHMHLRKRLNEYPNRDNRELYELPFFPPPPPPPFEEPPLLNPKETNDKDPKNFEQYSGVTSQLISSISSQWKITSVFLTLSISILTFFEKFKIDSVLSVILVMLLNTTAVIIIIALQKDWLRTKVWKELIECRNGEITNNIHFKLAMSDRKYRENAYFNWGVFTPSVFGHGVLIVVAFIWVFLNGVIDTYIDYQIIIITGSVGLIIWGYLLYGYKTWFKSKFSSPINLFFKTQFKRVAQ